MTDIQAQTLAAMLLISLALQFVQLRFLYRIRRRLRRRLP